VAEAKALTPAEKLQTALDLFEGGVAMMRDTLKREHPEETEAETE
jgi:hypothetical protein